MIRNFRIDFSRLPAIRQAGFFAGMEFTAGKVYKISKKIKIRQDITGKKQKNFCSLRFSALCYIGLNWSFLVIKPSEEVADGDRRFF